MIRRRGIKYIRVSSDEQRKTGHSLEQQEDIQSRFYLNNNIEEVKLFVEDHSAKSFDRPEWKKLFAFVKENRHKIDIITIVDWSRFSRNALDAFTMVEKFKGWGIEVQAIEQPLDFKIPESKIMLAIYCTVPEVDNIRRAANIKKGIYRARKSGQWAHPAPWGYRNRRDENDRAYIEPDPKEAPIITWVFEEYRKGLKTQDVIREELAKKGIKLSRNGFSLLLRNPVYIGKVPYLALNEEELGGIADGQHSPIVNTDTFYEVQDMLSGRRRIYKKTKTLALDNLPLRGHIKCSRCGGNLTGSTSTGRAGGKFFYYHCRGKCKERIPANVLHDAVTENLKSIRVCREVLELYYNILLDVFKKKGKDETSEVKRIEAEIKKNEERLSNVRKMVADKEIDAKDYNVMKAEYEKAIFDLHREKDKLRDTKENIEEYVNYGFSLLKRLDIAFEKANADARRQLIGSIFPDKIIFSESKCRTIKDRFLIELIRRSSAAKRGNKKGHNGKKSVMPIQVVPTGIEPVTHRFSVYCSTN